jgi:hypothetical protein
MQNKIEESAPALLDYFDELEKRREEMLHSELPKTESEWLEIFPEARKVIRDKIDEWTEVADIARASVSRALQIVEEKCSPENQSFGHAVLKYSSQSVSDLAIANRHIKRLKWLLPSKGKYKRLAWKNALDRARNADLVAVAKSYGLQLRRTGKTYSALCPLHTEKTPSFHIYPPSRFICFGCQEKGDAITFLQRIARCSFKESVYKLQNL